MITTVQSENFPFPSVANRWFPLSSSFRFKISCEHLLCPSCRATVKPGGQLPHTSSQGAQFYGTNILAASSRRIRVDAVVCRAIPQAVPDSVSGSDVTIGSFLCHLSCGHRRSSGAAVKERSLVHRTKFSGRGKWMEHIFDWVERSFWLC